MHAHSQHSAILCSSWSGSTLDIGRTWDAMEPCHRLQLDSDSQQHDPRLQQCVHSQSRLQLDEEPSGGRLHLSDDDDDDHRDSSARSGMGQCQIVLRLDDDADDHHNGLSASTDLANRCQPQCQHRLTKRVLGIARPGPADIGIEAYAKWAHDQCDPDHVFRKFTLEHTFTSASLCSGLDAGSLGRAAFFQEWNRRYPQRPLQWEPYFACDLDATKLRVALAMQPRLHFAFTNAHDVGAGRAWDIISSSWQEPPSVTWLDVGVPCLHYSSMNNQRKESYHSGESNAILSSAFQYIEKKRPRYVMFENVTGA